MEREVKQSLILKIALGLAAALAIASLVIAFLPRKRDVTELEKSSVQEFTKQAMLFMEELDPDTDDGEGNHLDRYIAYALEYSYEVNNKSELKVSEIKELISKFFDIELNEDELNHVGITPILLDKNVNHESIAGIYSIHKDYDKRQIANIPITSYIERSIESPEPNEYTVVFDKYTAKSPYDILPHAEGAVNTKDYLEGKGHITTFKSLITADNAERVGEHKKQTTVNIVVKDGKTLIKSWQ